MSLSPTVLAALIGAIITLIGILTTVTMTIQGWREERRRIREEKAREVELEFRRQQLNELYGPLWGMVLRNQAIYEIAKGILPNDGEKVIWHDFQDHDSKVWDIIFENFLIPTQSKAFDLITTKTNLLRNGHMSDTFQSFLIHHCAATCLHALWKQHGISSLEKFSSTYPVDFNKEVELNFKELTENYDALRLQSLSSKNKT